MASHTLRHRRHTTAMTATMGSRIRDLRKRRRLTQVQLASLAGITQGTLSLIENNESKDVAGATLAGLCRALKTTPEFIVAGAGDPDSIEQAIAEHELVFLWRDLPAEGRRMVIDSALSATRAFGKSKTSI